MQTFLKNEIKKEYKEHNKGERGWRHRAVVRDQMASGFILNQSKIWTGGSIFVTYEILLSLFEHLKFKSDCFAHFGILANPCYCWAVSCHLYINVCLSVCLFRVRLLLKTVWERLKMKTSVAVFLFAPPDWTDASWRRMRGDLLYLGNGARD